MDRAKQRALEAYPIIMGEFIPADDEHKAVKQDRNEFVRKAFIKGYYQAEKDLALTWEDMQTICNLTYDVLKENNYVSLQGKYTEVLKRFLESKNV